MNILYVLHDTTMHGGATKSFLNLLLWLIKKDVCPIVLLPNADGLFHVLKDMSIPVYAMGFRWNTYPKVNSSMDVLLYIPRLIQRRIRNYYTVQRLSHLLKDKHIDIIHSNVSIVDVGFRIAQKLNIPHIYHIREYADKDFGLHYVPTRKSFLKSLNKTRSYSICITKDIQQYFHLSDNTKSKVIYNGIQEEIRFMPHLEKKRYFLYAGRIDYTKGIDVLLIAYNDYVHNTKTEIIPLYIAGNASNSSFYNQILSFIKEHNLSDKVSFLGQRDNVDILMQQAQAIIVPSRSEGFGRCLAEAMFNGCLSICYNAAGLKEQLENGIELTKEKIGLSYDTPQQLTCLLEETAKAPADKYQHMKEMAFFTVSQLYTREKNAESIYEFYFYILNDTDNH
ncbi:MAG: glycosyltransferase [Prevotella sp.]|nr:glycosyltransferase [Prevotella sp.]